MGASDPMLLTLPRPARADYEFKHAHDFIPPPPIPTQRTTFKADQDALPSLQAGASEKMAAPHRGLPPPSVMASLPPDPVRAIPPPLSSSFAGMPEPPRQWQGAEEAMSRWLSTKAEEEKRKQEEERTRQESFRLEQRRIESTMLIDAIRNGVPPHLVPVIFAGIGAHSVANSNIEWLQQYNNSLHAAQQQQLTGQSQTTGSPDARRERLLAGPPSYPPSSQIPGLGGVPQPPLGPPSAPYGYASNPMSPTLRSQQLSGPSSSTLRGPVQQVLPRLATEEQRPGAPPPGAGPQGQVQLGSSEQSQSQSSPGGGIFFHHWQPPASSSSQPASANQPPTPSEYANSPKRRKAQTSQPPIMPPTSEPRYNSSSFVHVGSPAGSASGARKRRLSDTSTTARPSYAPSSRKNRSRGNTESSAAISEEDRLRYRQQYPVGGPFDDRSDTGSHYKRSRQSHDHADVSGPASPKREQVATTLSSDRNSYGPAG